MVFDGSMVLRSRTLSHIVYIDIAIRYVQGVMWAIWVLETGSYHEMKQKIMFLWQVWYHMAQ